MSYSFSANEDSIKKLSNIIELDHKVWTHYSEFLNGQQFSRVKNYLWMAVTIIGFLAAIFARYIDPIQL